MLLRSSSTPVLGSLLSSSSESPVSNSIIHYHDANTLYKHHSVHHQRLNRSPYYQSGCRNLPAASCNSSPISPPVAELSEHSQKGFRRVQSDGNLEGLAYVSCNSNINKGDQHRSSTQSRKFSSRPQCLVLETIPSFSFSNSRGRDVDDDEDESDSEVYEWTETPVENVIKLSGQFDLSNRTEYEVLDEEARTPDRIWNSGFVEEGEMMYLARGLGIDGPTNGYGGGGGGVRGGGDGDFYSAGGDSGDDGDGTEAYYKKMVQENPGNPLFLRNYAQFLYQTKRDLNGADEYYSRAILADPKDGEILSQYANLVWELYKDKDRASTYFERAVRASPDDSHIHAAYASFLWENEEDEKECGIPRDFDIIPSHLHEGALASAGF